jgi:pyruvate dehydrogenase E1 component alpha subunit
VPLHYPEHEAIAVFGDREQYEAAKAGDPVPQFRGRLVADGTLSNEEADAIVQAARDEMQEAVTFGVESPFPDSAEATAYVYA